MNNQEFRDKVYEKYEIYKDKTNDKFFHSNASQKVTSKILRMATSFAVFVIVTGVICIGGIYAYSALGGKIDGIPAAEWFGIKFSDEYDNYVVEVNKSISREETKIELVSTMCDEGFTVLEFDVHLSQKDKEYLRLGEKIFSEEEIEEKRKQMQELRNQTIESMRKYMTDEEIENYIEENASKNMTTASLLTLDEYESVTNTLKLLISPSKQSVTNYETMETFQSYSLNDNFNLKIDGEEYFLRGRSTQNVIKISDYEYKIYQFYFITDKELNGKSDFTLTLDNLVLINCGDRNSVSNPDDGFVTNTLNNERYIEFEDELEIQLSKSKSLENSRKIVAGEEQSSFKNMTKKLEDITVTPMQTVIKVNSVINNVSLQSLASVQNSNYIESMSFEVYDQDNNLLNVYSSETSRIITYSDGRTDEWDVGEIGTYYEFYNATMELTEYIIVETNDKIKSLRIVPIAIDYNNGKKQVNKLDGFTIDLTK